MLISIDSGNCGDSFWAVPLGLAHLVASKSESPRLIIA